MKRLVIMILTLILSMLILIGCSSEAAPIAVEPVNPNMTVKGLPTPKDEELREVGNIHKQEEETEPPKPVEVQLVSVGDVMMHRSQLIKAYDSATDSFSFDSTFEMVDEYIRPYDFAVANLETTLSGKDKGLRLSNSNYYKGYQGFPTFNSPEILAKNIKDTGFDMVTTANNHCYDGLKEGVISTLDVLDSLELDHVGTYRNPDENRVVIKDIGGIRVAFLNYTYSTNGINPKAEDMHMVNTLDNYDPHLIEAMYKDVEVFKDENDDIDYTVVYIHFGNEYKVQPNDIQRDMVESLIKSGADAVIGTHPHVLQPMEKVTVDMDDGSQREGFVFYSLGNFVSSQIYTHAQPYPKDVGIILNMTLRKEINGEVGLKEITLTPTWNQWLDKSIRIIPIHKALSMYEQEANYYELSQRDYNRLLHVKDWVIPHVTSLMDVSVKETQGAFQIIFQ